jgi:cyclopropane-fatty-acyl-phospholipid synthase
MKNSYKQIAEEILGFAGVTVNGNNPWDIQVYNDEFYKRAITEAELGIGESYMDGWWNVEKIDEFIYKVLTAHLDEKVRRNYSILLKLIAAQLINLQSKRRAFIIGKKH